MFINLHKERNVYLFQGETCSDEDVIIGCNSQLCLQGDCEEDSKGHYHCVCTPGYIGTHCNIANPCYCKLLNSSHKKHSYTSRRIEYVS